MEENNNFTEVTSQSWGSRIMESIKSVIFGIVLFLASFIVLWWNEGRTIKVTEGLNEGASLVTNISAKGVNPENEAKLVYLTDSILTKDMLTDDEFGVAVNALKLNRVVEVYQWKEKESSEKKKKTGGGQETITTYDYSKEWSTTLIDSDKFKKAKGHRNPRVFVYEPYSESVKKSFIGDFQVSDGLLSKISNYEEYPINESNLSKLLNEGTLIKEKNASGKLITKIYIGTGDKTNPKIGDTKVYFKVINPSIYSIIAKQMSNTFEKYTTSNGTNIELIKAGKASPEQMFAQAQESNTVMGWVLRGVGFLMMFIGIKMVLNPLVVLADVIPFLGTILGSGAAIIAGVLAFCLSFLTIAIAWIFYRPILGISLLVIAIGAFALFYMRAAKKKKQKELSIIHNKN
jgi:hypothetical protein